MLDMVAVVLNVVSSHGCHTSMAWHADDAVASSESSNPSDGTVFPPSPPVVSR